MKKGETFICELEVRKGGFNRERLCNSIGSQLWFAGERITSGCYEVTIKKINIMTATQLEEVDE